MIIKYQKILTNNITNVKQILNNKINKNQI